jgi:hypothetical protein
MADEQEKGFVIKDKRQFDEKGDLKEEAPRDEKVETKDAPPEEEAPPAEQETAPLPEPNFMSLIFSLSSTALLHFGEIADPRTGEQKADLPLAKHSIDTIAMLKEKTEGNLTDEEQKFLESVLTDLKWRYVKAVK